jgi:Spore germination protein.
MFANNLKISSRQLKRMLVLGWIGRVNLIIPCIMAGFSGENAILAILVGVVFTLLYGIFISHVAANVEGSLYDYLGVLVGKVGRIIIIIVYIGMTLINTAFTLRLLAEVVKQCLLQEVKLDIILITGILVCAYGATGKAEGVGRTTEVLYKIILIPLAIMFCLAIPNLKLEHIISDNGQNMKNVLGNGLLIFSIFSEMSILLFTAQYIENKEKLKSKVVQAFMITGLSIVIVYITCLGMFGNQSMRFLQWPMVSLMSSVVIPGGFLNRWDIIFLSLIILSLFISIAGGLLYMSIMTKDIVRKGKGVHYILLCAAAIFFLARMFADYNRAEEYYLSIMRYFFIPIMLLIICIIWIMQKLYKKNGKEFKKIEEEHYEQEYKTEF